ncbi:MAG: HlyD family secretion protein [Heteroscytonema crispum UTEX LB 1556]
MTTQLVPQSPNGTKPPEILTPQKPVEPPEKPKGGSKALLWLLGGLVTVAAIGTPTWYYLHRPVATGLQLGGRIEGYETDIGAKIPGRVNFVAVREGDRVQKGEVIAKLDDAEIQAQLSGAKSKITAAQQQAQQATLQISVIETQIEEAQLNLQQSQGEARGKIDQAQSAIAAAEAQLSEAKAQLDSSIAAAKLAKMTRDRYFALYREGAYNKQQYDQAQTALETAESAVKARQSGVNAATKQVNVAQAALVQAQTASLNPDIRTNKIQQLRKQLNIAKTQLAAAQADVKSAQAAEKQILAQIAYLNVISPIDGVVTARSVEPGAVVGSGRTLLTVIDPNTVYLRGYIPEGKIGKIKVGQPAKVWLDSDPNKPLSAHIIAIDTQASFTPENIYFKQDRVEQVFGVKLSIDNPAGFAKPGMPADAEIDIK